MKFYALRGATTVTKNDRDEILLRTTELIRQFLTIRI
jgi:chorismate mutase